MSNDYPDDWNVIATRIKERAGWCCERCDHRHDPEHGYMLGTHHLDGNKANCEDWNLAALCQRCHLHIQPSSLMVLFHQLELFELYEQRWLMPHKEGYRQSLIKLKSV